MGHTLFANGGCYNWISKGSDVATVSAGDGDGCSTNATITSAWYAMIMHTGPPDVNDARGDTGAAPLPGASASPRKNTLLLLPGLMLTCACC